MVAVGTGIITTIAGTGAPSYSGDGGAATSAGLNYPTGVALDTLANIYIADQRNNRIRMINHITGAITTVAGNGNVRNGGDGGPATSAQLYYPTGIALDPSNNLYIADTDNNRIREVVAGTISTIAGSGNVGYSCKAGAAAISDGLHGPTGVAVDASIEILIADYGNQCLRVDQFPANDNYVVGNGKASFGGDGGSWLAASVALNYPAGVAADEPDMKFYIADYGNHRVRVALYDGTDITTFAGTGVPGYSGDGGLATAAQLYNPTGVAFH